MSFAPLNQIHSEPVDPPLCGTCGMPVDKTDIDAVLFENRYFCDEDCLSAEGIDMESELAALGEAEREAALEEWRFAPLTTALAVRDYTDDIEDVAFVSPEVLSEDFEMELDEQLAARRFPND